MRHALAAIVRVRGPGTDRMPIEKGSDEIVADVENTTRENSSSSGETDPPLVDAEQLASLRDAIDEIDFREMIDRVPDECGVWLAKIKEALASADLETARLAAHGLRGMAGNFAALRIAAIAGQIEFESQTVEEAERKTLKLETAIRDTRCWMESAA